MTNTQKLYIREIARWYYLTPSQLKELIESEKEIKTIRNQLKTMLDNGLVKRLIQPYTNEYVYTPTYKAYRLAGIPNWKEKKINLYNFNHTDAIIKYVIRNKPKSYSTERELISKLYAKGERPSELRTPDLAIGNKAFEFELTFKSKARYIPIIENIDNQLGKEYKKWVWVIEASFIDKLKNIVLENTLEQDSYFSFEILDI